ncbi:MAG: methyltransferase domain-containing protein [Minisyncoccia bacterium]
MDPIKTFWNSWEDYSSVFSVFDSGAIERVKPFIQKHAGEKTAGDFGCGHGHFLPWLSGQFAQVEAIDFSSTSLAAAQKRVSAENIHFHNLDMRDMESLHDSIDVVVTINSILPASASDADTIIGGIYQCLTHNGAFVGVLPSSDTVIYLAMLEHEQLMRRGLSDDSALMKITEQLEKHEFNAIAGYYKDFESKVRQKYFYPFEIRHRFENAGFKNVALEKLHYPWEYCREHHYGYFQGNEEIWDWLVVAEKPA